MHLDGRSDDAFGQPGRLFKQRMHTFLDRSYVFEQELIFLTGANRGSRDPSSISVISVSSCKILGDSFVFEGEDLFPIVFHADHRPAVLFRLGHADSLRYTSLGILSISRPNGEAKALLDRAHAISVANASALRI
jgi:hypothetical protein